MANDWNGVGADVIWDAGDMACGELVGELRRRVRQMQPRQTMHLIAHDPGARMDIRAWCRITGHPLVQADPPNFLIERKED